MNPRRGLDQSYSAVLPEMTCPRAILLTYLPDSSWEKRWGVPDPKLVVRHLT